MVFGSPRIESLEGELEEITYRSDEGYTVARIHTGEDEPVVIVGHIPLTMPGEVLRLQGQWKVHPRFGHQFEITQCRVGEPQTLSGVKRYLASGVLKGIGERLAGRIVSHFGQETLNILDSEIERLCEIPGISSKKIDGYRAEWAEHRASRELMVLLYSHGLGPAYAERIIRTYGPQTEAVITGNPYQIAEDVPGVGFIMADKMAEKSGIPSDSPLRIKAGILYALRRASDDGHVMLPRAELLRRSAELLKINTQIESILDDAVAQGLVNEANFTAAVWGAESRGVYLPWLKRAEEQVAIRIRALAGSPQSEPEPDTAEQIDIVASRMGMELAAAQTEAVRTALDSRIVVVTGGPGTGKTTLVRLLVELWEARGETVILAAPTGRAAKRLAEATGREAKTLHRTLEFEPRSGKFQRNATNVLEAHRIVVDEISMVDLPLFGQLMAALPEDGSLVLVGDENQLPSVGPGSVLRDLISSGAVPTVALKEVYRQAAASQIVRSAHDVLGGNMPQTTGFDDGSDYYFFSISDSERAASEIVDLVARRIPDKFGIDPLLDIQVLCPMHKGELGDISLGARLQQALNPSGPEISAYGRIYRQGDRVMQLRNDYDRDVFNGDLGRITTAERDLVSVRFDGRDVEYGTDELDALMPAYAITVHKSQGSEYPAVVIPVVEQHYVMLQRNLLYTAITRGKKLVVLVGSKRALAMAVKNDTIKTRYGGLAQRLLPA